MTKAISSAADFLKAIAGKTELFPVEGATVELRSLEWAEVETLYAQYGDKPTEMTFQAARMGIVAPQLDEAQWGILRKSLPGAIQAISNRVMAISGMLGAGGGPLAGTGSSPSPGTDQPT